MPEQTLIDDQQTLDELTRAVTQAQLVALDTEFVRESTYYPKLCLVQVATDSFAGCVDCLAGLDLGPLFEALTRPGCTWVLHSGTQDLEVLWLQGRARPQAMLDTQIAAALLGCAAQISLQELLSRMLGIELGKGFTRTDWSRRPLPDGALLYALDDVRHLLPLWQRLERELAERGRLEWAVEDSMRRLQSAAVGGALLGLWARLKGLQVLPGDVQAAAFALVRWREDTAQKLDRPRRWILSDELLVRIAQTQPATVAELAAIPDMPKRLAARSGGDILQAVESRDDPAVAAELALAPPAGRPDRDALKALQQHVRERSEALGIQSEVLASRRDLAAWLNGQPPEHLRTGWRAAELELPAI